MSIRPMLLDIVRKIVKDKDSKNAKEQTLTYDIDVKFNNKQIRLMVVIKSIGKFVSFTYLDDAHNLTVNVYGHKREEIEIMLYRAVSVYMTALELKLINNAGKPMVMTVIRHKASEKLVTSLIDEALLLNETLDMDSIINKSSSVDYIDGFCYSTFDEFKAYTENNKSYPYVETLTKAITEYQKQ